MRSPFVLLLTSLLSATTIAKTLPAACPTSDGIVCGGHGTCETNGDVKVCQCDRGYGGEGCTVTGCADPTCSNHGSCQDPAVTPGVIGNIAFCECESGWTGEKCSTSSVACNPACVADNGVCEFGSCKCKPEFAGPTCAELSCGVDQKCSDHGTCDTSGALEHHKCVCEQGFRGRDCSSTSKGCEDPSCSGNGQCNDEEGVCVCNTGFSGKNCKVQACPDNCNWAKKQGQCADGLRCECASGFAGAACHLKDCPNKCGGHGDCALNEKNPSIEGICICNEGFYGADCMALPCPNNCNGNGECKNVNGRRGKSCQCNAGFTGSNCLECDPKHHCNDHGTCHFTAAKTPICECFGGFSGMDCGMAACPVGKAPGLAASICSGQGECARANSTGQYACKCNTGYGTIDCHAVCPRGTLLDGTISELVCSGHGYCADSNGFGEDGYGHGQCVCEDGWTGTECSEPACMRSIPRSSNATGIGAKRPCGGLGQGACVSGACFCRAGFTPPSCAGSECPNDCSGNGVCMGDEGKCACDNGFGGDDCSEPACCDPDCNNHGTCKSGRCHCEADFFGPGCADDRTEKIQEEAVNATAICEALKNCYGRGFCNVDTQSCECEDGYYGETCLKKKCLQGCNGRGECNDNGICECEDGYGGKFCGRRACPQNCNGRGYCINGTCFCRAGWEGVGCSSRSCKDNCNAMGVCKAGVCACLNGYSGESCGEAPCPGWAGGQPCSGHGICNKQICSCTGRHPDPFDEPMWTGLDCATKTCPSGVKGVLNACSGHGECDAGTCKCKDGWKGKGCEIKTCSNNCHGRGTCNYADKFDPVCDCKKGYLGVDCGFVSCEWDPIANVPKPGCHENLIPAHGMCGKNGTCYCALNYTGKFCENVACKTCGSLDKCPNRCNNVGKCTAAGTCQCNVGFSGEDCSTRVMQNTTSLLELPLHRLVMSDDQRIGCHAGCNAKHENDDSERWACMTACVEKVPDPRIMMHAPHLLGAQ